MVCKDTINASESRSSKSPLDALWSLVDRGRKFGAIYIDPPFKFDRQPRGAADQHYKTMVLEEIAALPLSQLAADNAHLHLWVPAALMDSKPWELLSAWKDFQYKTHCIWVKKDPVTDKYQKGTGYYYRMTHEVLILAVKGNCTFRNHSYPSVIEAPRSVHSRKPDVFRRMIEDVSPPSFVEVFAREVTPGWTAWGDQLDGYLYESDFFEPGNVITHQGFPQNLWDQHPPSSSVRESYQSHQLGISVD